MAVASQAKQPTVGKGFLGAVLGTAAIASGRTALAVARNPTALTGPAALLTGVFVLSEQTLTITVATLVSVPTAWAWADSASFQRIVLAALRNQWRQLTVYRPKWRRTMRAAGLHQAIPQQPDRYPRLVNVQSGPWMDRLLVQPCKGSIEDYRDNASDFALAFEAATCRIRRAQRLNRLWIELRTGDPLAESLKPPLPDENVDLERVQVGITEDGEPWTLRLIGRHLLASGETGAGKSSLIWAILWGLAPLIRDGIVKVWAVDPKGGMELDPGRALFDRYADDNINDMVQILVDAVAWMDKRKKWAKANGVRKHVPTREEPLLLVIVDEGAVMKLLASGDKTLAPTLDLSGKLLLTQGRAPGIELISAIQVPTKETLDTRDLYPDRVQFRTMESRHFGMTLGPGVLDIIDPSLLDMPGKAFYMQDGAQEPMLGRVFHIEDEDIRTLSEQYRPGGPNGHVD